jgi:glyoxylase-like metal-dependent hydrolase (beta-lactamase superfamily II)
MDHESRHIGRYEIVAVVDADFPDEPWADAFPDAPPDALRAAEDRYPGLATDDGRWRLRVRAWIVRHDGGCLLLDTGLGGAASPSQLWAPTTGGFAAALDALEIPRADVDTLVISHVHTDHVGGLLDDDGDPLCPEARHVIQRADLEWQRRSASESDEDAAIWRLLASIEDGGLMVAVDGDHALGDTLSVRHVPGHTPGHQVLVIEDAGERIVLTADTWNHPIQLANPDWAGSSDDDHALAAASRRTLLADFEAHPGTIMAPAHFAEPFGTVHRDGDHWMWVAEVT